MVGVGPTTFMLHHTMILSEFLPYGNVYVILYIQLLVMQYVYTTPTNRRHVLSVVALSTFTMGGLGLFTR